MHYSECGLAKHFLFAKPAKQGAKKNGRQQKADRYERGDLLEKVGWATMPGSKDLVEGAAGIRAQQLVNTAFLAAAPNANHKN